MCRRYIKDIHLSEDVMITGFVKIFSNLKNFSFQGSFEGWIRRIITNATRIVLYILNTNTI
ncbi:RNA polymerase sigma factor [Capnocytophaga stomatis]|uniref:RNA polymerase sigma factor n=1 Tax=Capnocytophaga stomatis TaxID=1848904 RepID=UPI003859CB3C